MRSRISRRRFVGQSALLGTGMLRRALGEEQPFGPARDQGADQVPRPSGELDDPTRVLYSVCLNCNTGCGVKVGIRDGIVAKLEGNPYSPWTLLPHLPMETPVDEAARVDAALCPKGQAAVQTVYDPYRIRTVLKRAGPRGQNRWRTIPFDQAVREIVEGGRLFVGVPGEENRVVEGLRGIMALRNEAVAGAMAEDAKAVQDKKLTVREFQAKHAAHLNTLIDPDHPDLGPKNNQLVIAWGRLKGGRSDFIQRFGAAFGTRNLHGHTTVCQGSLYFTSKAISEQYREGAFSGGQKFYWQADTENARYILFVGANLFEANYGPTNRSVRLTANLVSGRTRIAVVDPRFSKLASKAQVWLPIKPGEDAALAMAIIRWMFENGRYDAGFLRGANPAAAAANGETSWTNATWLVEVKDGMPGSFVRARAVGLGGPDRPHALVVMVNGKPVAFDPNDRATPVNGDLLVDTTLTAPDGSAVRVKSSLQLLREEAERHSFDEWCAIADLPPDKVAQVARELTSYGKQAVAEVHRGVAQHTNGFYNVLAWMSVNLLLGNVDWKGGLIKAATYDYSGSRAGPFNLSNVPGRLTVFGTSIIRHEEAYEKSTLFAGYPAKRNWYPLASDVYQEIVPSIGEAYPYPVKALFLYMGTPIYALPAGHSNIGVLADVQKLPLFITSDVTVGTTSKYADYVFPDLTWLERWEFHGSHPNMAVKVQPVRQPVAGPIPEVVRVYGEEMPISLEAVLMAFAERLGLKAFGPGGLGDGINFTRPEDYYLRAVANLAAGERPGGDVPSADARELDVFVRARRHLPKSVFDEVRWRSAVGEQWWPKVVYLLNRGGRFDQHAQGYEGDRVRNRYGALLNLYQEKTASYSYSGTGKRYPGIATYVPISRYDGTSVQPLAEGYDLQLITNRTVLHTKSRTIGNYWLTQIMPENAIVVSARDARRLGLKEGDQVRVLSATNAEGVWDLRDGSRKPIIGKVAVVEGIRPGVVTFVVGYGHWATGAVDIVVDGRVIKGDSRRATGVHANAAMWTDPSLRGTTCLVDPVGGSVSFYDTRVRLVKV